MEPIKITSEQGIVDFYEAFSRSDFDLIASMLHEDCVLEFPGTFHPNLVHGRDNIVALLKVMQGGLNGTLRFHTKWAVFQNNMVAAHWHTTAKTEHGGAYMNRGVAWFRLQDGLVIEFLDFLDTEIIAAFWPNGESTTDFTTANQLTETLYGYAPDSVRTYFDTQVK